MIQRDEHDACGHDDMAVLWVYAGMGDISSPFPYHPYHSFPYHHPCHSFPTWEAEQPMVDGLHIRTPCHLHRRTRKSCHRPLPYRCRLYWEAGRPY